jgi:4-hydroxy-tetrahydrodipicolinate reductase
MSEAANSIAITIVGASGRMGKMLLRAVAEAEHCHLVGAVARDGSDLLGQDAGAVAGLAPNGVYLVADPAGAIAKSDAVIDFTTPEATVGFARLCAQAGAAHIVGTTGLEESHVAALEKAARHVPVVYAPNMSVGVNLLLGLTQKVAATLGPEYDIEIVEMHHRHKVDAPSGTALGLGHAAARGRGVDHDEAAILSREGQTGPRPDGAIGYATLRGGDVVGEHTVVFAGPGERIEITHKASDRAIFAQGAVRAALWSQDQKAAVYSMADVLGLSD